MDDVVFREEDTTLKLDDLERMKFDLNEEKSKLRKQEIKLSKIHRFLRHKEMQIEIEKKFLQQRKECMLEIGIIKMLR